MTVRINEREKKFIKNIIAEYAAGKVSTIFHEPNTSTACKPTAEALNKLYLKKVMVCSPHETFSGLLSVIGGLKCPDCTAVVSPDGWSNNYRYVQGVDEGLYVLQRR